MARQNKMQTEQGEAEAKFWTTPELIEKLFSNLNLESTLSLARLMNKEILKRGMTPIVWPGQRELSYQSQ